MSRRPFSLEECEQWELVPNRNPRTGRKISMDAPHGVAAAMKTECKRNHDWTSQECLAFQSNDTVNPRTGRKIKHDGPIYTSLQNACNKSNEVHVDNGEQERALSKKPSIVDKKHKNSSPRKKKEKVRALETCLNNSDPITLELFDEMNPKDQSELVRIGRKGAQHCMTLDSAYAIYEEAVMGNKDPRDPYNPSHVFTSEEIKTILTMKKAKDKGFKPPKFKRFSVPDGMVLEFLPDMFHRFYKIQVVSGEWLVYDLGWIPANIEPEDSGSVDVASSVQISKIRDLWESGKLFSSYVPGFMEINPDLPVEYHQSSWYVSNAHGIVRWNMNKYKEYARIVNGL